VSLLVVTVGLTLEPTVVSVISIHNVMVITMVNIVHVSWHCSTIDNHIIDTF